MILLSFRDSHIDHVCENEIKPRTPPSPGVLSIAMYPAIHSYEQAFDNMSEESEKNNFIIKKSLRPVPSQYMVEQARKHGGFRPQ